MGTFTFDAKEMLYYLVASWLTVAFMIYAAIRLRNCMPYVAFGICWFIAAFAPVSNLLPMFNGPFADYYLGLPSIGLSIAVACLISDIYPAPHRPSPLKPAFARVLILLIYEVVIMSSITPYTSTINVILCDIEKLHLCLFKYIFNHRKTVIF